MASISHYVRSLNGAGGTGAGAVCSTQVQTRRDYIDRATRVNVFVAAGPVATVIVEALMPGDATTWVQVATMGITAGAAGYVNLIGPFLDLRLNCTAFTSGSIVGDIMWNEAEWF